MVEDIAAHLIAQGFVGTAEAFVKSVIKGPADTIWLTVAIELANDAKPSMAYQAVALLQESEMRRIVHHYVDGVVEAKAAHVAALHNLDTG